MEDIKSVIDLVVSLFNTPISFGSFSFTLMQSFIALIVLELVIYFVKSMFGGD